MPHLPLLADLIPPGIFVGTSLILCQGDRFLYGVRPVRPEADRLVGELTGIGGKLEPDDVSLTAGVLREAQEEMACAVTLLPAGETLIARGPGEVERVTLAGPERPAALVMRHFRTPPHAPWHPENQGRACLVVFLAELAGRPRPDRELPYLIWLRPAQIVTAARRDVPLSSLLAAGAELVTGPAGPPAEDLWLRMTDSQEALVLALGEAAESYYDGLGQR